MKRQHVKGDPMERRLRDAYLGQPDALPREEWIQSVMGKVRQEPVPVSLAFPNLELLAWRAGWVAAVAASIFALLSLTAMPSRDNLAWDLYKGGAVAQLSVRIGE